VGKLELTLNYYIFIPYTRLGCRASYGKLIRAPLIKAPLAKTSGTQRPPEEIDAAIRQHVSKAIMAEEGDIDIFTTAGLKKQDISILSEQFLAEVHMLKHKNITAELLAKLLKDEIKLLSVRNLASTFRLW